VADPRGEVQVYQSRSLKRSQRWRWRIVVKSNGRIIADSAEGYSDQSWAKRIGGLVLDGYYGADR